MADGSVDNTELHALTQKQVKSLERRGLVKRPLGGRELKPIQSDGISRSFQG